MSAERLCSPVNVSIVADFVALVVGLVETKAPDSQDLLVPASELGVPYGTYMVLDSTIVVNDGFVRAFSFENDYEVAQSSAALLAWLAMYMEGRSISVEFSSNHSWKSAVSVSTITGKQLSSRANRSTLAEALFSTLLDMSRKYLKESNSGS